MISVITIRRFARAGVALLILAAVSPGAHPAGKDRPCEVWSDQVGNPRCRMPADVLEADRRLNLAWRALLDAMAGASKDVALLRLEQRDWLVRRDKTSLDDLKGLYDQRLAYLEALQGRRETRDAAFREATFGRYGQRERLCFINTGCEGYGDSEVFILPAGEPGKARVLVDTLFFNGHSCTLDEVGSFEGPHLMLQLDVWDPVRRDVVEKACRVRVAFTPGKSIAIENPADCQVASYCGARGSLFGTYPRWRAGTRSPR